MAFDWFGEWASDYVKSKRYPRPIFLAPIPGSSCVLAGQIPRTFKLADAIATRLQGVEVWDGLRWKTGMTPSSKGGTRDPQELYERLKIFRKIPAGKIILIDDVRTTAAHLRAARAAIKAKRR